MHEYLECTEHSDVASVVPCLSRAIRSVTGIGIADLRVSAAGVARKMCMSKPPASTGITGERYALPTQHTSTPQPPHQLQTKYFAWKLDLVLTFAVCFPEDTKRRLAGGVLC